MDVVKLGSKGDDVKVLQEALGLKADGVFGSKTEEMVKAFQKEHKLTADGIVGNKTWELILPKVKKDEIEIIKKPINTHITKCDRKIEYIVLHFTAGASSTKGSASRTRDAFIKREASADFCVDDEEIVQVNPDLKKYYCWAVGDGKGKYGITNKNSISIEICSTLSKGTSISRPNHGGWHFTDKVLENTEKLCKYLMNKYGISFDKVVRHYDASRKACPGIVGWNDATLYTTDGTATKQKNSSGEWIKFKERLKK